MTVQRYKKNRQNAIVVPNHVHPCPESRPFLSEGREMIMSEFGKVYANYLSILQLIAGGMTTQNQIDTIIGKNTGTYLKNLDEDYSYVSKLHPLFSKPGGRNVKWCIEDCSACLSRSINLSSLISVDTRM